MSFIRRIGFHDDARVTLLDVARTLDNGAIVLGFGLQGDNLDMGHPWVILFMPGGGPIIRNQVFSLMVTPNLVSVAAAPDGGYVLTGRTPKVPDRAPFDVWVLKLNPDLTPQWSHAYGGGGSDEGRCVRVLDDGTIVVAARTTSFGGGGQPRAWLLTLDPAGSPIWQFAYSPLAASPADPCEAFSVAHSPSSDKLLLVGSTLHSPTHATNAWMLQVDRNGHAGPGSSQVFQATDPGGYTLVDVLSWVEPARLDPGFVVAGRTQHFRGNEDVLADAWLLKLDDLAGLQWQETFFLPHGAQLGACVRESFAQPGYVVAGTSLPTPSERKAWLVHVDRTGGRTWERWFDTSLDLDAPFDPTALRAVIEVPAPGTPICFAVGDTRMPPLPDMPKTGLVVGTSSFDLPERCPTPAASIVRSPKVTLAAFDPAVVETKAAQRDVAPGGLAASPVDNTICA